MHALPVARHDLHVQGASLVISLPLAFVTLLLVWQASSLCSLLLLTAPGPPIIARGCTLRTDWAQGSLQRWKKNPPAASAVRAAAAAMASGVVLLPAAAAQEDAGGANDDAAGVPAAPSVNGEPGVHVPVPLALLQPLQQTYGGVAGGRQLATYDDL